MSGSDSPTEEPADMQKTGEHETSSENSQDRLIAGRTESFHHQLTDNESNNECQKRQIRNRSQGDNKSSLREKPKYLEVQTKPKNDEMFYVYKFGLLFIGMLVFGAVIYIQFRTPTIISTTTTPLFDMYRDKLTKMHSKYTNQTDRFWITFLSSLVPILGPEDPDLPAVIMMAVPEDQHLMGLCFLQHVGEVLNKILDGTNSPSYVDGSKYSSLGADQQKVKIDEDIRKIIQNKQRTVIVTGLEKIDPHAILLFHGYCDNSEAVFKDIAIIFMLQIPADSNYSKDEEVYAFLFKLWTALGPSKTKALLARMANNVAIMQKSDHFIC